MWGLIFNNIIFCVKFLDNIINKTEQKYGKTDGLVGF